MQPIDILIVLGHFIDQGRNLHVDNIRYFLAQIPLLHFLPLSLTFTTVSLTPIAQSFCPSSITPRLLYLCCNGGKDHSASVASQTTKTAEPLPQSHLENTLHILELVLHVGRSLHVTTALCLPPLWQFVCLFKGHNQQLSTSTDHSMSPFKYIMMGPHHQSKKSPHMYIETEVRSLSKDIHMLKSHPSSVIWSQMTQHASIQHAIIFQQEISPPGVTLAAGGHQSVHAPPRGDHPDHLSLAHPHRHSWPSGHAHTSHQCCCGKQAVRQHF